MFAPLQAFVCCLGSVVIWLVILGWQHFLWEQPCDCFGLYRRKLTEGMSATTNSCIFLECVYSCVIRLRASMVVPDLQDPFQASQSCGKQSPVPVKGPLSGQNGGSGLEQL